MDDRWFRLGDRGRYPATPVFFLNSMTRKQFLFLSCFITLFTVGCWSATSSPTRPYVKPSAADGGTEDPAIRAIEAAGGTCFRYSGLKGLLVDRDSFWMEHVEGNPVICVEVDDCRATADFLKQVVKLNHIQNLCIRRSSLSDAEAAHISQLKSLRSLRLENTNFTSKGISDLANLKLRHLNFDSNHFGDQELKIISTIGTLVELHLNGSNATDTGVAHLADLDELKYLHLGGPNLSDSGIAALSAMKSLEELSVTNSNVTGIGFKDFDEAKIRILKMNHCKISPAGLGGIAQITAVQELSLFCSSVTDGGLISLSRMPNLNSLNLYGNAVTVAGLQKLLTSKSLRTVDVAQCKISKAECRRFNRVSGQLRAITYDD